MSRPHREPSSRNGRVFAAASSIVIASIMWSGGARAEEPAASGASSAKADVDETVTPRVELRYRLWLDLGVTAGTGAATLAWVVVRPSLVSLECLWCEKDASVNAVDDFFRTAVKRADDGPASLASDIFGWGLAPLSAVGLGAAAAIADRRGDEAGVNTLIVAEATVVNLALDQAILAVFRRERPWFHAITDPDAKEAQRTANAVSSFPSGHTSTAFALGASAGTIATMRGYRLAPLVWIVGMAIGATTAYLRMAADRHYFTDTLAGAALGMGVGVGVPVLFHGPKKETSALGRWMQNASISSAPVEGGRVVSVGWAF